MQGCHRFRTISHISASTKAPSSGDFVIGRQTKRERARVPLVLLILSIIRGGCFSTPCPVHTLNCPVPLLGKHQSGPDSPIVFMTNTVLFIRTSEIRKVGHQQGSVFCRHLQLESAGCFSPIPGRSVPSLSESKVSQKRS